MRAVGERADIIKRIHRGLADQGIERNVVDFALDGGDATPQLIGRLVRAGSMTSSKGPPTPLSTESTDVLTMFAWSISTLRPTPRRAASSSSASSRMPLAAGASPWRCVPTCPSTPKSRLAAPPGSTASLLLVNRPPLGSGELGREVRDAMGARVKHLVAEGLARGKASASYSRGICSIRCADASLTRWQRASARALAWRIISQGGRSFIAGPYRQRFNLASGRFALIDD